ncbi:MAG: peptidoglycan bridge formation glycyltransferase FemA/FemB family protein [Anaerolineaceae bacterium]|nr:peptidoglycan bridge formation glycyltransferase FemA/FemB family protein [Anaerolineaceae bacterium]
MNADSRIPDNWNEIISALPGASLLQTSQWSEVKARVGWKAFPKLWKKADGTIEAAALILKRPLELGPIRSGASFLYVPRGPLMDWNDDGLRERVLADLESFGREQKALFVKIDPDVPVSFGEPGTEEFRKDPVGQKLLDAYQKHGWVRSPQQIQFANSVWINTEPDEDVLLANMKQRTRYKVRLAEKKGVTVRRGTPSDFDPIADLYAETSARDGFLIRGKDYYLDVWQRFYAAGMLTPLIAEVEGSMVAAVMIFVTGDTARYVYGMSGPDHREKMPNYLLQWEAVKLAKEKGCRVYDLWGAPDEFTEEDRMWGVYQFKRGLGGEVVITPGAWDLPLSRIGYDLFVHSLPKFISALKKISK